MGKVFLKEVKEREKIKQWKAANLDPRNASRYDLILCLTYLFLSKFIPEHLALAKNQTIDLDTIRRSVRVPLGIWITLNHSTRTISIGLTVVGPRWGGR